ncbi:hypothetical protein NDU88_005165 [Pleurodeles waltl]|uniref:Uncharacterized protein n=1 Tax=Pleurodeles waltl TaxID=8319 RepID=A0AAV7WB07_PLEWA|nr:hypothetical protein NDU88_005165 [Pleurodeles waltl]
MDSKLDKLLVAINTTGACLEGKIESIVMELGLIGEDSKKVVARVSTLEARVQTLIAEYQAITCRLTDLEAQARQLTV